MGGGGPGEPHCGRGEGRVTSEQRPEGGEGISNVDMQGCGSQTSASITWKAC